MGVLTDLEPKQCVIQLKEYMTQNSISYEQIPSDFNCPLREWFIYERNGLYKGMRDDDTIHMYQTHDFTFGIILYDWNGWADLLSKYLITNNTTEIGNNVKVNKKYCLGKWTKTQLTNYPNLSDIQKDTLQKIGLKIPYILDKIPHMSIRELDEIQTKYHQYKGETNKAKYNQYNIEINKAKTAYKRKTKEKLQQLQRQIKDNKKLFKKNQNTNNDKILHEILLLIRDSQIQDILIKEWCLKYWEYAIIDIAIEGLKPNRNGNLIITYIDSDYYQCEIILKSFLKDSLLKLYVKRYSKKLIDYAKEAIIFIYGNIEHITINNLKTDKIRAETKTSIVSIVFSVHLN